MGKRNKRTRSISQSSATPPPQAKRMRDGTPDTTELANNLLVYLIRRPKEITNDALTGVSLKFPINDATGQKKVW